MQEDSRVILLSHAPPWVRRTRSSQFTSWYNASSAFKQCLGITSIDARVRKLVASQCSKVKKQDRFHLSSHRLTKHTSGSLGTEKSLLI